MNNKQYTTLALGLCGSLIISSCSNDSPFEGSSVTGDENAIDPAGTVITQIATQNFFSVAQDVINIEAVDTDGNTANVSIIATDRHGNPVPDNTAIRFEANHGAVEPQCLTTDGRCTATWTEHGNIIPATNQAIIIAYTPGEESFLDLNDNDAFDAGEIFTDISEPFYDIDGDGVRNPAAEEYIDANSNGSFDGINGLFTGLPCVGDNTVCDRTSTLVWGTAKIGLVDNDADISITNGATVPTGSETETKIEITVVDSNGNPLADGAKVAISSNNGTVDPSTWDFAANGTVFNVYYTSDDDLLTSERLTIEVTTESGLTIRKDFP